MNGLSNLDETYKEYSSAPTDDLIRFLTLKIKVTTAGRRDGEGLDVEACLLVYVLHSDYGGTSAFFLAPLV